MKIYLQYNGEYDARNSRKDGTTKYQNNNFYLCTGLRHWMRFGNFYFRYNEVLWFLGGTYIDWTDKNFSINKITEQIIELSNDKIEDILKNTQEKLINDKGSDFQKWLSDSYS